MQLRKKPEKTNQGFNGIWTRDLAIHFLFKGIEYFIEYWGLDILLEVLIFFSGFFRNCINCVHKCEDHSSFDFISAVLVYDLFHLRLSDRWMAQHAGFKVVKAPCFCKSGPLIPSFELYSQGLHKWREVVAGLGIWLYNSVKATRLPHRPVSEYRNIPKISPSKYKPPKIVTQKTLR